MACANDWTNPLQVGSHHIARAFARSGWDVAFISDPISPAHLLKPSLGLKRRYHQYKNGGTQEGTIWSYVPGGLLTPYNHSLLKSKWLHKNWPKLTLPSVISKVKKRGFDKPDLLYLDSPLQPFWQDALTPKYSIYRLADNSKAFLQTSPAKRVQEETLFSSVDCVIVAANTLKEYVASFNPKRLEFVPNGVDFAHFAKEHPVPVEYKSFRGPIAIYVGAIREWFDSRLINAAAKALPSTHFVIIGPNENQVFEPLPNLHLLGAKPWSAIPAYLQHATVGMIPFDVESYPDLIHHVNPLKLYEYMASGLPVVSMEWEELTRLKTPALLATSKEEFIALLERAQPSDEYQRFAKGYDWSLRGEQIINIASDCKNPVAGREGNSLNLFENLLHGK